MDHRGSRLPRALVPPARAARLLGPALALHRPQGGLLRLRTLLLLLSLSPTALLLGSFGLLGALGGTIVAVIAGPLVAPITVSPAAAAAAAVASPIAPIPWAPERTRARVAAVSRFPVGVMNS